MHRIDGPAAAPGGLFTEGDPSVGTPATVVTDDWLNAVQLEIVNVIEGAGIVLSKPNNAQLLAAVRLLVDAATPVGTVLQGYYAAAPAGFVLGMGQLVSRTAYARLWAHVQAAGVVVTEAAWAGGQSGSFGQGDGATTFRLPDLRAEFLRNADLGRGVDAALTVGSRHLDAMQPITGSFGAASSDATNLADGSGAFVHDGPTSAQWGADPKGPEAGWTFDSARVARTAAETRPRAVVLAGVIKT